MQIKRMTTSLRPLTISGVVLGSALLYSDVDQFSRINTTLSDRQTADYVRLTEAESRDVVFTRSQFDALYRDWREKTRFFSSSADIIGDRSFQAIVGKGMAAVPYIAESIEKEPSTLVWALNYIYGVKISNRPNLTVREACKLWVKRIKG